MAKTGADDGLGEFDLIERFFAPLAKGVPGAFSLKDDAACLDMTNGCVVTTDMMVEGVHFLAESAAEDIARKVLRVNLSDLAAMGATPLYYTLALALPAAMTASARADWVGDFAGGLALDQKEFSVLLIGGDTVSTPGPITVAVTAFGAPPSSGVIRRSGAKAGDDVYVSGTIGDAVLGLRCLCGKLDGVGDVDRDYLIGRHRRPSPRTDLGMGLVGVATATSDVSDGLLQDLSHIAESSGLDIELDGDSVPLSSAAGTVLGHDPDWFSDVLAGGDDYELVFTAAPAKAEAIAALGDRTQTPITRIGRVLVGTGGNVRVLDARGTDITPEQFGFSHF